MIFLRGNLKLLFVIFGTVLLVVHDYHLLGESILFADQIALSIGKPPRTVVSISTFSQRIFHLDKSLDSLRLQSLQPDRVIVSIPMTYRHKKETIGRLDGCSDCVADPVHHNESLQSILAWFKNYSSAEPNQTAQNIFEFPGLLTLQILDSDWGPATKALGALILEHDPETVIITFDDDMVYNSETVAWLATHINQGMALSFGCEKWDSLHVKFRAFHTLSNSNLLASTPRVCNGWLLGWTAVAYRVGHFGDDIWTYLDGLPPGCFYNDDIWLSGYIAKRGVIRVYAPMVMDHIAHRRDSELSLSLIENSRELYGIPCARALFS
jgi:hypothetical protein